jgi:hypothetical protein
MVSVVVGFYLLILFILWFWLHQGTAVSPTLYNRLIGGWRLHNDAAADI